MIHNDKFRAVLLNLVGRDFSQIQKDSMLLNERLLFDINMGYQDPSKVSPHQSVKFYPQEAGYLHPWSIENIGEQFGVNKLEDFLPIHEYLHLPAHLVDRLISGMMKGRTRRMELDKEAREEQERREKERRPTTGSQTPEEVIAQLERDLALRQ